MNPNMKIGQNKKKDFVKEYLMLIQIIGTDNLDQDTVKRCKRFYNESGRIEQREHDLLIRRLNNQAGKKWKT